MAQEELETKVQRRMKRVLDPCCGSKMFWFDRNNPDVMFCDVREIDDEVIWRAKDGKGECHLTVKPDVVCSVTDLPFDDNTFWHVVFDPPQLLRLGATSWIAKKYGRLDDNWRDFIRDGFRECMRVLKPNGTLIFKWSEVDVPLKDVLSAISTPPPLYGHRSGKHMTTIWLAFIKDGNNDV